MSDLLNRSKIPCFLCAQLAGFTPTGGDMAGVTCEICGKYSISGPARAQLESAQYTDKKWILSVATKKASAVGSLLELTTPRIERLLERSPSSNPLACTDDLVTYIAAKSERYGDGVNVPFTEYARFGLRNKEALHGVIRLLNDLKLAEFRNTSNNFYCVSLMPSGWQRANELRKASDDGRKVFVAMAFDPTMRPAFDDGIRPAIEDDCGFTACRVDGVEYNGKVDDRIVAEIRSARFVVADFTMHRHGVYFEAGFGLGLGIEVVYCCREDEVSKAHFDTRQFNHVLWNDCAQLRSRLTSRIRATVIGARLNSGVDV